ncbi:unnamed protein product [Closterium sp. NIES-53]
MATSFLAPPPASFSIPNPWMSAEHSPRSPPTAIIHRPLKPTTNPFLHSNPLRVKHHHSSFRPLLPFRASSVSPQSDPPKPQPPAQPASNLPQKPPSPTPSQPPLPVSPTSVVTWGGRLPSTRRLVLGSLGFAGLALGSNFLGSTSALLGVVEDPARSARLDVLFPIKGYKRCYDTANGFEFLFPAEWVGDQLLLYRAAERRERELSLDPPPLSSPSSSSSASSQQARRAGAVDPVAAFGPPGGNGELNVSVVVAPVPRGFSLRSFGDAESIGGRLLANVIAPTGSGREAMLLNASEKELDGVLYIRLDLGYGGGSPLVKPPPTPPPVVTPSPSPLKETPAERAEAKFLEAQRNYITKWLPQFDWLLLDKGDDGLPCLRCSVCSEHGPDNARYGRNGSGGRDLQPASMRAHQASSRHHDCIDRQKGLLDKLAAQKKIDDYKRADPEGARVTRLMRSIQFVCDEDAPIAMFPRLVDFLANEGVSDIPQQTYGVYITQYGFTEMVKAMCMYQQQQQLMYIHASPWIGISCDESTDRSRGKHLVVFATFMKERAVVTEFLALLTIHKCDAGSLFAVLLSHLDNIGIDLQRIVAVSTDGAGVMIGSQSGLVVRLRQRVPHLVGTHCIAHR